MKIYIGIIFVLLLVIPTNLNAESASSQFTVAPSANSALIDAREFSSLAAAVASSKTEGKTIIISTPLKCGDLVVTENRSMKIMDGGSIEVTFGKKLIIKGIFEAASRSVFPGAGKVDFTDSSVLDVYVEWFGAKGDWKNGTGTDDTDAIQRTIESVTLKTAGGGYGFKNVPTIRLLNKSYRVEGTLNFIDKQEVRFEGASTNSSYIIHTPKVANTDCMVFSKSSGYAYYSSIRNLSVITNTANTRYLVVLGNQAYFNMSMVNLFGGPGGSSKYAKACLFIDSCMACQYNMVNCERASEYGVYMKAGNTTTQTFENCYINRNGKSGMYMHGISERVVNCIIESHPEYGIVIGEEKDTSAILIGNHFEDNGTKGATTTGPIRAGFSQKNSDENWLRCIGNVYYMTISGGALISLDKVEFMSYGDAMVAASGSYYLSATGNTKKVFIAGDPNPKSETPYSDLFLPASINKNATLIGDGERYSMSTLSYDVLGRVGFSAKKGAIQTLDVKRDVMLKGNLSKAFRGDRVTIILRQDEKGGHMVSIDSIKTTWTNSNNKANTTAVLTLVYDGTEWIQTSYVPWF